MSTKQNTTKSKFVKQSTAIPEPIESVDKANGIIQWGKDNLYPQWLNDLFYKSAIHSGIIRSKVHYTTSGGLNYEGEDLDAWKLFFKNGNSDFNLDEIAEQCSLDLELYNAFCLKGKWSLDKSRIEKIEVIDFETVRKKTDSNEIAVSRDWTDKNQAYKVYEPFSASKRNREFYLIYEEAPKQTALKKKIKANLYPTPPYSGGLNSINTDIKIAKYHLNEISNGFSTGTIINLNNGAPPDEDEKKDLERDIKNHTTGEDNAGGVLVFYNNGKDREASVVNTSGNDLNERYTNLAKDVRDNIVLSHSVTTPILFGVKTEGSLGNATELEIGYKIMNANYFEYRRRAITSSLNFLAINGNGLKGNIFFNEVVLALEGNIDDEDSKVANAINKMSPLVATKVLESMTPNEIRSLGDLKPIEGGDVIKSAAFEEQINVVELFEKSGKNREEQNIIFSRSLPSEFDVEVEKENLMAELKKSTFNTDTHFQVLDLISKGESFDSIKNATSLSSVKLSRIYGDFIKKNYITKDGKMTQVGYRQLASQDVSRIEIYYSYALNPTISGPELLDTSRDFCKALVNMSKQKVWSRQDIDTISSRIGYNAFAYRGGWYHNPKTDVNTPWCRHIWTQEIVYK